LNRALKLALAGVAALLVAATPGAEWRWHLPPGWTAPPVPADDPMSKAKVALGRRLFYDADLSIDGTMACATCHEQHRGFADGNRIRPGVHGDPGRRNVPGLANVAWIRPLTWADPRLKGLEQQVAVPVLGDHPVEMGMKGSETEIARRLGRDDCYVRMFASAFPERRGAIDMTSVAMALAAFERTLISSDTPYDRYERGDAHAIPPAARRGALLFKGSGGCAACHSGSNFTDGNYHRLEIGAGSNDHGLSEISQSPDDDGRFRTPGLRNVALTAPYMHDGSVPTIDAAIRAHRMATLSERDIADLAAFLTQLTDMRFVRAPQFSLPQSACGKRL
jgi:cytochrome c peroxidase